MHCAPTRAVDMEADIVAEYPEWNDQSEVDYSWDGLHFPPRPRLYRGLRREQVGNDDDLFCPLVYIKPNSAP